MATIYLVPIYQGQMPSAPTDAPSQTVTDSAIPTRPMAGTPIRVAIVGGGKMAQHHARAIARCNFPAQVVAVADPSETARAAMLAIAPGALGFGTLEELLREQQVEVVDVCTPPSTHERLAELALKAGCHIYVEKPFVASTDAASRLIALAESKGLKICPGHQLLYEPPARKAVELMPALGRLAHVESYFSFRTVRRNPDGRAPLRPDLQLLDILPHPVYLLLDILERSGPGKTELTSLEVGSAGTVHAHVRRGNLTGSLVVTLEGRPVECFLRLSGSNGMVNADFVRGTVQQLIGPGTSGIDKLFAPYQIASQIFFRSTAAFARRILKRQTSYPGLAELFEAFFRSIRENAPLPVSPDSLRETVRIWEEVAKALEAPPAPKPFTPVAPSAPLMVVTGGTGFLGQALVRTLVSGGWRVRVLARREPAHWDAIPGAEYKVADLAKPLPPEMLQGASAVIHAAAETAGGWEQHQANSLDATEQMVRAAAAAGVKRFLHVSSLAVLASPSGGNPVSDDSPLEPNSRGLGPYVWGKLESEKLAIKLGQELGVPLKIARPGALVDYGNFDPPGRLGKRLGPMFVAVGSPSHTLGVVDLTFTARSLVWMVDHFAEAPGVVNVLDPVLPTKRDLVRRLKKANPGLSVVWLPTVVLVPLSWFAILLQKVLKPGKPAMNVAKIFAKQKYDTTRIAGLAKQIEATTSPK